MLLVFFCLHISLKDYLEQKANDCKDLGMFHRFYKHIKLRTVKKTSNPALNDQKILHKKEDYDGYILIGNIDNIIIEMNWPTMSL